MTASLGHVELVPAVQLPLSFFTGSVTAMAIIREDGVVTFQNPAAARMFGEIQIGSNLLDWGPRDFVLERLELMRRLALTEQDAVVRDIWQGEQVLTHLRLLPAHVHENLRFFLTVHERTQGPKEAEDFPGVHFHDGRAQDLGPLTLLSPRELEVLALLGEGLTAAQIAARIRRSEDTVNTHRGSLLRKLDCQNASQLAVIAHRAGLKYDDAARFESSNE